MFYRMFDWMEDRYEASPFATALATLVVGVVLVAGVVLFATADRAPIAPIAVVDVECVDGCSRVVVRDDAFPTAPVVDAPDGLDVTGKVPLYVTDAGDLTAEPQVEPGGVLVVPAVLAAFAGIGTVIGGLAMTYYAVMGRLDRRQLAAAEARR
jgi:hypothetical protein